MLSDAVLIQILVFMGPDLPVITQCNEPSVFPQATAQLRLVVKPANCTSKVVYVGRINEDSTYPVLDDFRQPSHLSGNDRPFTRHGFQSTQATGLGKRWNYDKICRIIKVTHF